MKPETNFDFDQLIKNWPSAIVARKELPNFSGGLLNVKTIAGLDSVGKGIPGRFRVGRLIAYPTKNVIEFIRNRSTNL